MTEKNLFFLDLVRSGSACPHCKADIYLTQCYDKNDRPICKQLTSPEDQIYVQEGKLGLASYHFDKGAPFLNHSNVPASWCFDDGEPLPAKVMFEKVDYDEGKRQFRAEISWPDVPVDGDSKWKFEFKFSKDFLQIGRGLVHLTVFICS